MAVKSYSVWRCLVFDYSYAVYCDGGCLQNGAQEAQGYASFSLESRTGQKQVVRLNDLPGVTTNNQAEYVALISALVDLRGRIERAGKSPHSYSVVVHTDSQLLVGQLTQGWQVKAANLRSLVDEAAMLIQAFGRCDLVKVPRDEMVRVLGH
jgi:ribonuclease HI